MIRFFLLVFPFLFMACQRGQDIPPNTLVIALESGPTSLDPRLATDAVSSKAGDLLFNGLVKRNNDFSIAPDLAKSWETPDRLTYIFHLKDDIRFHNGKPLTSRDIVDEYKFILDPKNKSPLKGALDALGKIDAPDDRTVLFHLKTLSASFLGALTIGIVPSGTEEASMNPVGTGPFKFVEYRLDEKLVLKANADYFDGAPKLDGLILRVIPDETVRTLELERGAVHLIMNPITPDILPRFRKNKNLNVVTKIGTNYSYLGFNLKDKLTGNKAVREAIAHAIDRRSVIRYILKGLARPATGPISPAMKFYEKDVIQYEYDPAKAKQILDKAGFTDPDGDGSAERFTLKYSTSQNELRKRIAEVFQWQLRKIGVRLEIRSYEWGTFYADIKKGAFQLFSLTWVGISDPDILRYIFHSASVPPNGANRGLYKNKRIDKLTELGNITFGDERKALYSEVQKILAVDLPYISLWYPVNVAVLHKSVQGFVLAPDENLKSLRHVWME